MYTWQCHPLQLAPFLCVLPWAELTGCLPNVVQSHVWLFVSIIPYIVFCLVSRIQCMEWQINLVSYVTSHTPVSLLDPHTIAETDPLFSTYNPLQMPVYSFSPLLAFNPHLHLYSLALTQCPLFCQPYQPYSSPVVSVHVAPCAAFVHIGALMQWTKRANCLDSVTSPTADLYLLNHAHMVLRNSSVCICVLSTPRTLYSESKLILLSNSSPVLIMLVLESWPGVLSPLEILPLMVFLQ